MTIVCPFCHGVSPLEAALEANDQRQAYNEMLELTPFPKQLKAYLRLFAPAKRVISGAKKARLTAELVPMIKAARFERKGVSYSAPLEYWRGGFETLQSMRDAGDLTLPLDTHNLLLAVMANQINKAEARKEQQHEDQLAGRTSVGSPRPQAGEGLGERVVAAKPRTQMPQTVKAAIKQGEIK